MKLKLDDAGHVVVQDGKPIYTHDDGKELPFDAAATVATITRLNGEAKGHREAKEAAEGKLKAFEGIADPAAALKALETVKNLDTKKLLDAGEVERVKEEANRAYEEKLRAVEARIAPLEQERDSFKSALHGEKIGNAFNGSKLINEKLTIPADIAQAMFGGRFKVEDANIFAIDPSGNKLLSRANPGNVAGFDEALELIVSEYPNREKILKGSGANGGGAGGGAGTIHGKNMPRATFNSLAPEKQMAHIKSGGVVIDT